MCLRKSKIRASFWTLVCAWTVSLHLISRTVFLEVSHGSDIVPARGKPLRDEIQSKHTNTNTKTKKHGNRDNVELFNVDHVIRNAKPSHFEGMLR